MTAKKIKLCRRMNAELRNQRNEMKAWGPKERAERRRARGDRYKEWKNQENSTL